VYLDCPKFVLVVCRSSKLDREPLIYERVNRHVVSQDSLVNILIDSAIYRPE
jgi:hypothetical protein